MDEAKAVDEKPILFSGSMVRAILDGVKTQTRRVCKPAIWKLLNEIERANGKPCWQCLDFDVNCPWEFDQLWVRETWYQLGRYSMPPWDGADDEDATWSGTKKVKYAATCELGSEDARPGQAYRPFWRKRPSIHMPRWASRLDLKVKGIRVERVQRISTKDALAEGVDYAEPNDGEWYDPIEHFRLLWDSINAKRGYEWNRNPWVWVIDFKVAEQQSYKA